MIHIKSRNLKIDGYLGTWYVIDEKTHNGSKLYLLESELYGEDAAHLVVNENLDIIDEVVNGFSDL